MSGGASALWGWKGMQHLFIVLILSLSLLSACQQESSKVRTLLNVSYDPTRELYEEVNRTFSQEWRQKTGQDVVIKQSHGGSGKQARAVLDGLDADVVTLALGYDIDVLSQGNQGLLASSWQERLPYNSCPYTSVIVFLVRRGNPKNIKDWSDLVRPDVEIITPNPKTSGGARWNYLAAYAYALERHEGDVVQARSFVKDLFARVPVLDSGARGSTTTFVRRGIGDVLLTWENEALLAQKELSSNELEIVVPSVTILAEPPVAWLDKVVARHGTEDLAKGYLSFLYSDKGQELIAKHFYRPHNKEVAARYERVFPKVRLVHLEAAFGSWQQAQREHFDDGGTFDQIFTQARK